MKNENTKNWQSPKKVDLNDVSQTFSCLHEIHPNDLCQIIRPHQTSRGILPKHVQLIPTSLCLAVEKVKVIELTPTSAKPWSAAARSARRPLTLRPRRLSSPPKTYIPSATSLHTDVCPQRAAGAVPLGDS